MATVMKEKLSTKENVVAKLLAKPKMEELVVVQGYTLTMVVGQS